MSGGNFSSHFLPSVSVSLQILTVLTCQRIPVVFPDNSCHGRCVKRANIFSSRLRKRSSEVFLLHFKVGKVSLCQKWESIQIQNRSFWDHHIRRTHPPLRAFSSRMWKYFLRSSKVLRQKNQPFIFPKKNDDLSHRRLKALPTLEYPPNSPLPSFRLFCNRLHCFFFTLYYSIQFVDRPKVL